MDRRGHAVAAASLLVATALAAGTTEPAARSSAARATEIDFARDVRPILESHCIACHGAEKDKAKLRLDVRERALAGAHDGTAPVIVPGDAQQSSLYQRLVTEVADERMPQKAPRLSDEQIDVVRRWIEAGAPWPDELAGSEAKGVGHWAYRAPQRPALPAVRDGAWVREPIDAFVLARLEREGLAPMPEADRATLLRRLSLDLIGLPPTPDELAAFEGDASADAYERQVDRLLASPHFGERMARPWLDLARYADTHGYEKDARRTQWPYRDWVIEAFNRNLPFDRFTVLQLAGDLAPDAGDRDRVATGFHRNTMLNEEGGIDPEEFRVDAVVDRVNTTGSVWLGSTLACAQCHDHKYDPVSQREYYAMFAVFNSTEDGGVSAGPQAPWLTLEEERRVAEIEARIAEIERQFSAPDESLVGEQKRWEQQARELGRVRPPWTVLRPTAVYASSRRAVQILDDGSALANAPASDNEQYEVVTQPGALEFDELRLEALRDASLPGGGPGVAPNGAFVLGGLQAYVIRASGAQEKLRFIAAEATYEQSRAKHRAAHSIDPSPETGWAVGGAPSDLELVARFLVAQPQKLEPGDRLHVILEHATPNAQHALGRFRVSARRDVEAREAALEVSLDPWRLAGPYRYSSREAALAGEPEPLREHREGRAHAESYPDGVKWIERVEWADRMPHRLDGDNHAWVLARRIVAKRPRQLEVIVGADDALRLWLNGELVAQSDDFTTLTDAPLRVEVPLREGENRVLLQVVNFDGAGGFSFDTGFATSDRRPEEIDVALALEPPQRSPAQLRSVREHFRRRVWPPGEALSRERDRCEAEVARIRKSAPSSLVMRELHMPRETRVHERGDFLSPGEVVEPGVPAVFGALEIGDAQPRWAFANWLVSRSNPLVARVHVNRLWELVFGRGIVASTDDFGTRGEAPTHPELLDWLAVEFMESGWDQKALLKRIVSSATYRQSSDASSEAFERDPDNALLARGARFRVEAEMLRDIALRASGLLSERIGGPSVMPPQPPGVWRSTYSNDQWFDARGEDRFRRGLYTFWKRTAPYLTFSLFEAPSRELACTRRDRTNTPLQALALLDDPAFVEASAALAERVLRSAESDDERLGLVFRLCTARRPDAQERNALGELLESSRAHFAADPQAAQQRLSEPAKALATTRDTLDAEHDVAGLDVIGLDVAELAAWMSVATVVLNLDDTVTRR